MEQYSAHRSSHPYRIYSNQTHDKHQWLLLQFIVLLKLDAKGVRNMQSILVVFNKHNTARVASCWFIIYYISNSFEYRDVQHTWTQNLKYVSSLTCCKTSLIKSCNFSIGGSIICRVNQPLTTWVKGYLDFLTIKICALQCFTTSPSLSVNMMQQTWRLETSVIAL